MIIQQGGKLNNGLKSIYNQKIIHKEFTPKLFSLLIKWISKEIVTKDIHFGSIVRIIVLPLAIAFASGVSLEKGILTAIIIIIIIIYAFGGSRVQIGGPTAAFIVIYIVQEYGTDSLTMAGFMADFSFRSRISKIPMGIMCMIA